MPSPVFQAHALNVWPSLVNDVLVNDVLVNYIYGSISRKQYKYLYLLTTRLRES